MPEIKTCYCRIDFVNFDMEYNYTICPWNDISDQIYEGEHLFETWDGKEDSKPCVKLSPVLMSEAEYDKWFEENVEPTA